MKYVWMIAGICLAHPYAFAQVPEKKLNPASQKFFELVKSTCMEGGDPFKDEIDKKAIFQSIVENQCSVLKVGKFVPSVKTIRKLAGSAADVSEIKVSYGACIDFVVQSIREGRVVGGSVSMKGINVRGVMNKISDLAAAGLPEESACRDVKMCGQGAEADNAKQLCEAFLDKDSLRRVADTIATSSPSSGPNENGVELVANGYKQVLQEAVMNRMMSLGHQKLPPMPAEAQTNGAAEPVQERSAE